MGLLPDSIICRLPRLRSQESDIEPFVYARLYLPSTPVNWYVLEGEPVPWRGWVVYCFFTTAEVSGFGFFGLSALEAALGPDGQPVVCDPDFIEGLLTDVVPAPDS